MNKKALLALLLALCMMLSSCALVVTDPEVDAATPIVTIGEKVFTKAEVQQYVENYLVQLQQQYAQQYQYSIDTTDPELIASAQDEVIDSLIRQQVLDNKAAEMNISLTEEEKAEVASEYQEYHDMFASWFTGMEGEELENAISYYLYMYTGASDVETMEKNHVMQKLYDEVVKDVTVDDAEVQANLDSKVESAKSSYASNLSSYGTAVNNGTTVYYRPAGYRMVKNLLIELDDASQTIINGLKSKASQQRTAANTALTSLNGYENVDVEALKTQVSVSLTEIEPTPAPTAEPTEAPVTEAPTEAPATEAPATEAPADPAATDSAEAPAETEAPTAEPTAEPTPAPVVPELVADVTDTFEATEDETQKTINQLVRDYVTALSMADRYEAMAEEVTDEAFAAIDAEADDVIAQLDAGADWDTLMAEHSDDPGMQGDRETAKTGYAVCEGFSSFDSAFVEAAMAIESVGGHSPKTRGSYGYYIIQYTSDVAEGPVALEDVRETVESDALKEKQDKTYNDTVDQWVKDCGAVIDKKPLN